VLAIPASAQSEAELVKARQLYSQGLTQEAASDWAGALATFEDVARIKLTPQVRFHIARSKEHLGRLNEALGGYRLAEYEASQGSEKEQEILADVQKAREDLEKRIPKLTIERGDAAAAIKVELDGVVLGDPQVGKEITIDPGPHVVAGIVGPGRRFKVELSIKEGETQKLVLDVPKELQAAAEPPPPAPAEPSPAPAAPAPDQPVKKSGSAAPWIVGGLGVASLVTSAVFYVRRNDAKKQLDDGCLGSVCPDTLRDTQKRGETDAAISGVALGVGIAALGASTLMFLGRSSESEPRPSAAISVAPQGVSLSYAGRF
jgi:hypothetical protein